MEYTLPMASAQVKSCVLLAGLFAEGRTTVHEPVRTRDHTELALREFGADVEIERHSITVTGRPRLQGRELRVPGDLSAAAFFLVAALIVPESSLTTVSYTHLDVYKRQVLQSGRIQRAQQTGAAVGACA